jgi:hypothetical protein
MRQKYPEVWVVEYTKTKNGRWVPGHACCGFAAKEEAEIALSESQTQATAKAQHLPSADYYPFAVRIRQYVPKKARKA